MNTLSVLVGFETDVVQRIVDLLNTHGITSDEESGALPSTAIEKWKHECDLFLREKGYSGGALETCGGWYSEYGAAIYAVYDTNKYNYSEAVSYLDRYVDQQLQKS